ncbi:MAG: restriction endonuclease, partial [Lachnospiraceae bacterium]|nr:restriction endonuclease [Lachnospiraceae bacterium]
DVVCMVSDCIIEYTANDPQNFFTVRDIWYSDYSVENVQRIFSKPNPAQKATREYDKYFGQPIKLLEAAGVIHREKQGKSYVYSIAEPQILEYISFRERNSFDFLCLYIEKVLKDSGIFYLFENFFALQDKNSFENLKNGYAEFVIRNTPINGETECSRIFTKVLNPLACKYGKRGTERGFLSKDIITQDMLIYNRKNWRDLISEKPKGETRTEHEVTLILKNGDEMEIYRINRAKRHLKKFNDRYRMGKTELYDNRHCDDRATQMHHIFPAADYPLIADDMENLIALTPTQHLLYAHPDNNTHYVDREYQRLCLIAKTESIRKNLIHNEKEPVIYNFNSYLKVLNCGFQTDEFNEVHEMDFNEILKKIEKHYE